jgi:hypothetical protein
LTVLPNPKAPFALIMRMLVMLGLVTVGVQAQNTPIPADATPGYRLQMTDLNRDPGAYSAEIVDPLEEALVDVDAESLPDPRQAGVIGQVPVEGVAEVPAVRQVEAGRRDEVPFRADPLEVHDELQLEENHGIDARPTPLGILLAGPLAHEAEVELGLKVTVEMVCGDEGLKRDGDRLVEAPSLGGTKHGALLTEFTAREKVAVSRWTSPPAQWRGGAQPRSAPQPRDCLAPWDATRSSVLSDAPA